MERGEEVLREFLHPDPYIGAVPHELTCPPSLRMLSTHGSKCQSVLPYPSSLLSTRSAYVEIPQTSRWSLPRSAWLQDPA